MTTTNNEPGMDTDVNELDEQQDNANAPDDDRGNETDSQGEVDESLFSENSRTETTPSPDEDRDRVKKATINKALERVLDDGAIEPDKLSKEPQWVQNAINEQYGGGYSEEDKFEAWYQKRKKQETHSTAKTRFTELLPQIVKDNNLNKAQQSELAAVMKTEMSYGKPKDKALEDAAKLCGFTNKEAIDAAETNAYQRGQSALPKKGNAYAPVRRMNTITLAEYDAMPPKQKTAYIKDSTERHGELLFK